MLFKGTASRTARTSRRRSTRSAGQLDAFTAKEYASYYVKVLDEHVPIAVDILSDIVLRPAFHEATSSAKRRSFLEEIKMVEDTPDDLVHEIFTQAFWEGHPLGRPIPRHEGKRRRRSPSSGCATISVVPYAAENVIISAAGNLEHAQLRARSGGGVWFDARCRTRADERAAARHSEGDHPQQGARSRATCASAPPAIPRTTATATRATS
jgi:hypothetical protein